MVSNKNRNRAIEWLNSRKLDFHAGLAILQEAGFKPGVLRVLAKHGPNGPDAMARLKFHITTYANMTTSEVSDDDAELHVFEGKEAKQVTDGKSVLYAIKLEEEGKKEYPSNVRSLLHRYAHCYNTRSQAELDLANLTEDNDEVSVKYRRELLKSIEECTDEMERLYPYWQQYSTDGNEPTPDEVEGNIAEEGAATEEEEEKSEDEDEYAGKSKDELQAIKKSISTKISRAQNMLDYQTETKGEVLNPLLDPVKITKYKAKIERLTIELNKVRMAIAKFG